MRTKNKMAANQCGNFLLQNVKVLGITPHNVGWWIIFIEGNQTMYGNEREFTLFPIEWGGGQARLAINKWNDDVIEGRVDSREFDYNIIHGSDNITRGELESLLEEIGAEDWLPPEDC